MNILIILDVDDWAISNLTKAIVKYNKRHKFFFCYAHPKMVPQAIPEVLRIIRTNKIDLIHVQYWNSGWQMLEYLPELRVFPKVLTHHNHKHLKEKDWKKYFQSLVVPTTFGLEKLKENHNNVYKIPHGLDLDEFSYIDKLEDDGNTIGYVGRVLPHKNLDKICDAANKLGYKVLGTGYVDKPDYWEKVDKTNLEFIGGIGRNKKNTWESKNDIYKKMTCFVAYSTGEAATGTLPLLEAMARGVPVLATEQGMARDLIVDGVNGLLFNEGNFEEKLGIMMSSPELRNDMRKNARKTMNQYTEEKMAIMYDQVYTKTLYPEAKKVSVIIPTHNRVDTIIDVIDSVDQQVYPNLEIIVVDDGSTDGTEDAILEHSTTLSKAFLYLKQLHNGYGLASARNRGVLEARGEILVFLDDRLKMEPTAVSEFVKAILPKHWDMGLKIHNGVESVKANFIENFSCIYKKDLVRIGMFNERLEWYGGMSQDVRERCHYAGIKHAFVRDAKAHTVRSTPKMKLPEEVWKSKLLLYKIYGE